MTNEFKFSALRQFGSENISFSATIHSDNVRLSDEELQAQVDQVSVLIEKAFIAVQEREFSEKDLLAASSDRRRAQVEMLDAHLKEEMDAKKKAGETLRQAERESARLEKLEKKNHG